MQLSEPMDRLFYLHRQAADEAVRAVRFQRSIQGKVESILATMEDEEQLLASILQPVFAGLKLSQNSGTTEEFIPALALNGPHRDLAPIVHELLQAFCEYLVSTAVYIRATVTERENSDGELCLGLVWFTTS